MHIKRVVIEHTQGPFAGLFQIAGRETDLDPSYREPGIRGEGIELDWPPPGRVANVVLVRQTRTYLHFREEGVNPLELTCTPS